MATHSGRSGGGHASHAGRNNSSSAARAHTILNSSPKRAPHIKALTYRESDDSDDDDDRGKRKHTQKHPRYSSRKMRRDTRD